jgi:hypothetical protein
MVFPGHQPDRGWWGHPSDDEPCTQPVQRPLTPKTKRSSEVQALATIDVTCSLLQKELVPERPSFIFLESLISTLSEGFRGRGSSYSTASDTFIGPLIDAATNLDGPRQLAVSGELASLFPCLTINNTHYPVPRQTTTSIQTSPITPLHPT